MTPSGVVTPTGAVAPGGFPAAAGGVNVSGAITSVVPGIRKLKSIAVSGNIEETGGEIKLDLPKASYMSKATVKITGELYVKQGAEKVTLAKVDPRRFIKRFEFSLSGTVTPRALSGIQSDVIDGLDLPAISPNNQLYNLPEPAKEASASKPFELEMSPGFTVSPQNLYGIPYLGSPSTVPQFEITFGNPDGTLIKKEKAGPEILLKKGYIEVELWRLDLPAPVMPQTVVSEQNGQKVSSVIPGQGLYAESGMMLISKMYEEQKASKNAIKNFEIPIGPDYTRIIVLVFSEDGVLDTEVTPILQKADLSVQQVTVIESKKIWQFDNEYRHLYNKSRPTGVYVFSGIDETGTDADLYVTRELGNFDLTVYCSENEIGENAKIQVVTQELVPLSKPGIYL